MYAATHPNLLCFVSVLAYVALFRSISLRFAPLTSFASLASLHILFLLALFFWVLCLAARVSVCF